jgi:catalase
MKPSTEWKETIAADEGEKFERFATILADIQRTRGGKSRALHAKQHAGLRAELEVLGDLPPEVRVALFAEPKKYDAYVRFSNGAGARVSDDKPDLRGFAIKVLGVPGKKLISGMEDETTQDFLFINTPALAFRSVDEFVFFVQASTSPALLPFRLFGYFGFGTFSFLKKLLAAARKVSSLATEKYFTVAPIRFGKHAARLSLAPLQDDGERKGQTLRDDLLARLAKGPLAWDLRAQLFVDDERTPIEDTSKPWSEADAPPVTIARVTIPQQEPIDDLVETLSFDPWHACEELRPLGAAMRARNPAYRESTKTRGAAKEPR